MKKDIAKNIKLLLLLFLSIFSLFIMNNVMDNTLSRVRIKKIEESNLNYNSMHSVNDKIIKINFEDKEYIEEQVFDLNYIEVLSNFIRNMEVMFFRVILVISVWSLFVYIKRWSILVLQYLFKFFIMHYLQLKDGKKNALSLQF